jgi:RNA polymerase sigma-70 factor, ECF subfamily
MSIRRRALAALTDLDLPLDGYHLFHAARGELLGQLGRGAEARAAQSRALELTRNQAEVSLLNRRLFV